MKTLLLLQFLEISKEGNKNYIRPFGNVSCAGMLFGVMHNNTKGNRSWSHALLDILLIKIVEHKIFMISIIEVQRGIILLKIASIIP